MPRGNRIHFRFAELDIEDNDCQVNYLRLYNGIGLERSQIGESDKAITGSFKQFVFRYIMLPIRTGSVFKFSN